MSKHIHTIYGDMGEVDITQYTGPAILGEDRRCLQIGNLPGLSREEVQELSQILVEWLGIASE